MDDQPTQPQPATPQPAEPLLVEPVETPLVEPVETTPPEATPSEALPPGIDGLAPGMTFVRVVRGPRRWPGIVSCVVAVLMLAATGSGIQVVSDGNYSLSTTLAYTAIALSVIAILFGLFAIVKRWARAAGIVGVIVAVAGNPLVLLYVLKSLSGA